MKADGWAQGRGWGNDPYGDVLVARASGELPEMESSKALARRLGPWLREGDHLLDAGCGAGHYLRSLRTSVSVDFTYTGMDVTLSYLAGGKSVFAGDPSVSFCNGDLFGLPFEDGSFDVVMCNNVFLHLPSIEQPLKELCRVAKRSVTIRTLIGDRSMIVRDVRESGDEFLPSGEPRSFNFHNIYSRAYIEHLTRQIPRVRQMEVESDEDFDPAAIEASPETRNMTRVIGGMQVSGYILQPWAYLEIELS